MGGTEEHRSSPLPTCTLFDAVELTRNSTMQLSNVPIKLSLSLSKESELRTWTVEISYLLCRSRLNIQERLPRMSLLAVLTLHYRIWCEL